MLRGGRAGGKRVPLVPDIALLMQSHAQGGFSTRALDHSIFIAESDEAALREVVREDVRCHFDGVDSSTVIRMRYLPYEVIVALSLAACSLD